MPDVTTLLLLLMTLLTPAAPASMLAHVRLGSGPIDVSVTI